MIAWHLKYPRMGLDRTKMIGIGTEIEKEGIVGERVLLIKGNRRMVDCLIGKPENLC